MIELPNVHLVCIDCLDHNRATDAMLKSMEQCHFGAEHLFTSMHHAKFAQVPVCSINAIKSMEEYTVFILEKLAQYLEKEFVLIIQHDGYVLNGENWNPEFLEYDYIGAPARWYDRHVVGNGGFSLRSRRLMQYLADHPQRYPGMIEDKSICIERRAELEYFGFKFAPEKLAMTFSVDASTTDSVCNTDYNNLFGFHGKRTLEIIQSLPALVPEFQKVKEEKRPIYLDIPRQINMIDISKKISFIYEQIGEYMKGNLSPIELEFIKKHFTVSLARETVAMKGKERGRRPDAIDTLAYGLRCIEMLEMLRAASNTEIPRYEISLEGVT